MDFDLRNLGRYRKGPYRTADGMAPVGAAPGTEPLRENRETPPRHVRWLIAGAGLGFILGMGAMEALS